MNNECKCCPPKPSGLSPFPAMSAHFAHTLDDMAEQYLQALYINLPTETGTLSVDNLKKLLASRTNMVVYDNRVFHYSKTEGDIHKYINFYSDNDQITYYVQQVVLNGVSGEWRVEELTTGNSTAINNIQENMTNLSASLNQEINDRKEADEETSAALVSLTQKIDDVADSIKMDGGEITIEEGE